MYFVIPECRFTKYILVLHINLVCMFQTSGEDEDMPIEEAVATISVLWTVWDINHCSCCLLHHGHFISNIKMLR